MEPAKQKQKRRVFRSGGTSSTSASIRSAGSGSIAGSSISNSNSNSNNNAASNVNSSSSPGGGAASASASGSASDLPLPALATLVRPLTKASTLTASSSSSDYPHSIPSSDGGPSRRVSGAWDRQLHLQLQSQSSADSSALPLAASGSDLAHAESIGEPTEDNPLSLSSTDIWPREDSDDSEDGPAPSRTTRKSSRTGRSTTSFFRSLVQKFEKAHKRYGYVPNNQQEQDRNIIQHQIFQEIMDGRLHLAPTSKPRTVLDVGTGPGIWALEFAQKYPRSAVLGVDIEKVHPPYTVPNCRFQVMDVTDEWNLETKFDFIHVRMIGDMANKAQLVQTIFDHLNPGGWVEFTEWIVLLQSPNHSFEGTQFHKWNLHLREGLRKLGSSIFYAYQYRPLLQKTGFEGVSETKYDAPTNACYPGKRLQKIGTMMTENWKAIIEPLTMPVFTTALGWTPEQVKTMLNETRNEIGDTQYHSFMTLLTVCGRKPRDGGLSSSSASTSTSTAQ